MDDIIVRSKFEKAIREGNIGEVKLLTKDESCDVNQIIGNEQDEEGYLDNERPLSLSLQNIKSENDKWFQISQLLLEHKNIDVNAKCGKTESCTVLGLLCGNKCVTRSRTVTSLRHDYFQNLSKDFITTFSNLQ